MKKGKSFLLIFPMLLLVLIYTHAQSAPSTVVVNNADGLFVSSSTLDSSLSVNIDMIDSHCSIEASNWVSCPKLIAVPSNLGYLLDLVPLKLAFTAANASFPTELKLSKSINRR